MTSDKFDKLMFTRKEHLIIKIQPVSWICHDATTSCGGRVGESERGRFAFPWWKMEKGGPEFEFLLFKEVLCTPSWTGRFMPIPTLSFPLSEPLLMSCLSPYILPTCSGIWLVLLRSIRLCSSMMAHTMGPAHSINTSLKDQASQGGCACPENRSHKPQVVHIWHSSNGEGRVGWKRKTWKIR